MVSLLIMFFVLIGFLPTICKAESKEDNSSITMKVTYGIEGNFKGFTSVPVNIQIENNGEKIDGQLEVRVPASAPNTYDAFVSEVNIGANEKRTVTIPINLPDNALKLQVVLKQGENIVKFATNVSNVDFVSSYDRLVKLIKLGRFNGLTGVCYFSSGKSVTDTEYYDRRFND